MPNLIKGTARLTIGRFLYDWSHHDYCLLAYTSHEGRGVVATVPDSAGNAPDLWSVAARHESRTADHEALGRWCLVGGWSLNMKPKDTWFSVTEEPWSLEVRVSVPSFKPHQYGNTLYGWRGAHVGTLGIKNPDIIQRAHQLL